MVRRVRAVGSEGHRVFLLQLAPVRRHADTEGIPDRFEKLIASAYGALAAGIPEAPDDLRALSGPERKRRRTGHDDPGHQSALITWKGWVDCVIIGEGDNADDASDPRYIRIESASSI